MAVFSKCIAAANDAMLNDFDNWHYWRPGESAIVEMGTVHGLDVGLPPHFHEEDQITFVFSGRRRFVVGNAPVETGPGDAIRIPSWTPHRSLADVHELSCFNVYLKPYIYDVGGVLSALKLLCRRKAYAVCWPDIEAAIARYCNNGAKPPLQRLPPDPDETVARLAQLAGMSREGFSRHFKRAHGLSPQAFQIMARLNSARDLLREGASPIIAASEAGFADQSHMGRHFRRFFGVTPGRYRVGKVTSVLEILPQSDTLEETTRIEEDIMENVSTFCSCMNLACPLHPTKHDKGCAPCIQKNLRLKEMPNCFFNLVEGTENRTGDSFKDFAEYVLRK